MSNEGRAYLLHRPVGTTIDGELGKPEEANRELQTLSRFGYFKLKLATRRIKSLKTKRKELISEVVYVKGKNQHLEAVAARHKEKKKALKGLLHDAD